MHQWGTVAAETVVAAVVAAAARAESHRAPLLWPANVTQTRVGCWAGAGGRATREDGPGYAPRPVCRMRPGPRGVSLECYAEAGRDLGRDVIGEGT